jgi:hypothetical protein
LRQIKAAPRSPPGPADEVLSAEPSARHKPDPEVYRGVARRGAACEAHDSLHLDDGPGRQGTAIVTRWMGRRRSP